MSGRLVQIVPIQSAGAGPNTFYGLDEDGWVWYGVFENYRLAVGPEKINWRRLEHSRVTPQT
jgi:hypothetical protein